MTTEQFERAKELEHQINRLKNLLAYLKTHKIDDSPSRMTGFSISQLIDGIDVNIHYIENSELEFLICSIESQTACLEREFNRL